jgi:hypothetical protein
MSCLRQCQHGACISSALRTSSRSTPAARKTNVRNQRHSAPA